MSQPDVEAALLQAGSAESTSLWHGSHRLREDGDGVTVQTDAGPVRASLVIAADGGSGFSRGVIGAELTDLGFAEPCMVCDFRYEANPGVSMARQVGDPAQPTSITALGPCHHRFSFKTPHLVFADADLALAVGNTVASCTVFAGQLCMTGSRILVQREIAEAFTARLAEALAGIKAGPADDPTSRIGPMIDKAAVARVDRLVDAAVAAGPDPLVRGGASTDPALADGAFSLSTLLAVSDVTLPIVQDETFGPVQMIHVFDTEEEAIELANATQYGLQRLHLEPRHRPAGAGRAGARRGTHLGQCLGDLTVEFGEGGLKASGLGRLNGMTSIDASWSPNRSPRTSSHRRTEPGSTDW